MMNGLQRRDNLMDSMLNWFDDNFYSDTITNGSMKTDISENDHGYEVKIDMPGFDKKDLHLNYDRNVLTVTGHREANSDVKDDQGNLLHSERRYGQFSRQYRLPDVNQKQISAKYDAGVLTITLPKLTTEDQTNTRIEIQ